MTAEEFEAKAKMERKAKSMRKRQALLDDLLANSEVIINSFPSRSVMFWLHEQLPTDRQFVIKSPTTPGCYAPYHTFTFLKGRKYNDRQRKLIQLGK
jgi:hypothetical protein